MAPDARGLSRRGVLSFHFLDAPSEVWETHLFSGEGLLAETAPPRETDEMEPRWFSVDEVPYEQMWQDDKFWLPAVLGCERKNVLGEFWVRRFFFFSNLEKLVEGQKQTKQKKTLTFFPLSLSSFGLFPQKTMIQFESSSGPGSKIMTKHELTIVEGEEFLPPLPTW